MDAILNTYKEVDKMKCKVVIITIALIIGLSNVLMSEDLSSNPKSTGTESLVPPNATYFIGQWAGEWEHPKGRQGANFLIKEGKDGNYHCTYSWDNFQATMKPIAAGSASGIISLENDNTMNFKKPNYTITLIKKDENTLKGRWERIGPTGTGWPAHFEGYFKRVN
jgi:hypothetical protein